MVVGVDCVLQQMVLELVLPRSDQLTVRLLFWALLLMLGSPLLSVAVWMVADMPWFSGPSDVFLARRIFWAELYAFVRV